MKSLESEKDKAVEKSAVDERTYEGPRVRDPVRRCPQPVQSFFRSVHVSVHEQAVLRRFCPHDFVEFVADPIFMRLPVPRGHVTFKGTVHDLFDRFLAGASLKRRERFDV